MKQPERLITGPSFRSEIEKACGVRTKPSKGSLIRIVRSAYLDVTYPFRYLNIDWVIMDESEIQLPWDKLRGREGSIPWATLEQFSDALVREPSLWQQLADLYEQVSQSRDKYFGYANLYIPAIFTMAAPRLNRESLCRIGTFLVEKLCEAGRADDDILLEVLSAASGSLGPVVLPSVLDAIDKEPDHYGAWFFLWGLTSLAADSDDSEVRNRVVRACVDILQQADSGTIEPIDVIEAAWTLAHLNFTDSRQLLKKLKAKTIGDHCHGDFKEALRLLEGKLDYNPPVELWNRPVKEWLAPRWRMTREWNRETKEDAPDDDFDAGMKRIMELTEKFMQSTRAKELSDELYVDAGFIVHNLLEYAWSYAGASPEQLSEDVLSEVLLEVFPRKISAERDLFEKVAPITEAFLGWLGNQRIISNSTQMADVVRNWSGQIVANSMNPKCWGMGKSFVMKAMADRVDITDRKAVDKYIEEYNFKLSREYSLTESAPDDLPAYTPLIPIVNTQPKIGRNDSCPCGSGKKYKKCCGSFNTAVEGE